MVTQDMNQFMFLIEFNEISTMSNQLMFRCVGAVKDDRTIHLPVRDITESISSRSSLKYVSSYFLDTTLDTTCDSSVGQLQKQTTICRKTTSHTLRKVLHPLHPRLSILNDVLPFLPPYLVLSGSTNQDYKKSRLFGIYSRLSFPGDSDDITMYGLPTYRLLYFDADNNLQRKFHAKLYWKDGFKFAYELTDSESPTNKEKHTHNTEGVSWNHITHKQSKGCFDLVFNRKNDSFRFLSDTMFQSKIEKIESICLSFQPDTDMKIPDCREQRELHLALKFGGLGYRTLYRSYDESKKLPYNLYPEYTDGEYTLKLTNYWKLYRVVLKKYEQPIAFNTCNAPFLPDIAKSKWKLAWAKKCYQVPIQMTLSMTL